MKLDLLYLTFYRWVSTSKMKGTMFLSYYGYAKNNIFYYPHSERISRLSNNKRFLMKVDHGIRST